MNPILRVVGKALRLVGISSPEDALLKERTEADPPSWREQIRKTPSPPTTKKPEP